MTRFDASQALQAFNEWKQVHTLENRTLREMFLAGYVAREFDEANPQDASETSPPAANQGEPETMGCPAPDRCTKGPEPHSWTSDCEAKDEGWNLEV